MTARLRILVVSRSYPAPGDLYRYPFVHRRVIGYRAAGHEVAVFRPESGEAGSYSFDGVECRIGGRGDLEALAASFGPQVLAVHGLGPAMWPSMERLARTLPLVAWLHGSEIPGFLERKYAIDGMPAREALDCGQNCAAFWSGLLADRHAPSKLVFPSETAVRYMSEAVPLPPERAAVIPNPIDTDLFACGRKPVDQRFRVLFIRPFDSRCYANDVAVGAIAELLRAERDSRFTFRIFGDGPLFDDTVEPLRGLAGVRIDRRFLTQSEIAREHQSSGIFLVPTRLDTQGVSRDEAMASGLVPVTTAIAPVTEFVDETCARLVPSDDPAAAAAAIRSLGDDPDLFASLSVGAERNIRGTRTSAAVTARDIDLLGGILSR